MKKQEQKIDLIETEVRNTKTEIEILENEIKNDNQQQLDLQDLLKEKETEEELKKLYNELKHLCEQEKTYWEEFNILERNIYLYEKDKVLTRRKRTNFEKEIKIKYKNIFMF